MTSAQYFIGVSLLTPTGWLPLGYEERETVYTCQELRQVLRALGRLVPVLRGTETGVYRIEARSEGTRHLAALSEYHDGVSVSEWLSCDEGMCAQRVLV